LIVVDASVLVPALLDDGKSGDRARQRLSGQVLCAPEVVDLEVVSGWRRILRARDLSTHRLWQALDDLADLPLIRVPHAPLIGRVWELRDNLAPYDAAYVALAEVRGTTFVTADRRLAKAPGIQCEVDVLD
jgi:predicted nucleic acid-binding protein